MIEYFSGNSPFSLFESNWRGYKPRLPCVGDNSVSMRWAMVILRVPRGVQVETSEIFPVAIPYRLERYRCTNKDLYRKDSTKETVNTNSADSHALR